MHEMPRYRGQRMSSQIIPLKHRTNFLAIQRNRWLGVLMIKSQRNFQSSEVYALLVLVGLFGFVVNDLFAVMEGVMMRRWPPRA
jgi:hypothetical protein